MFRNLKAFVLVSSLLISFIVFFTVYSLTASMYEKRLYENAVTTSRAISLQTLNSLYQLMKRGWNRRQLDEMVAAITESFESAEYSVDIFRGHQVEELYGTVPSPEPGERVIRAFATGEGETDAVLDGNLITYVYPVKTTHECLVCHMNAEPGDVLGVIRIQRDLASLMGSAKRQFFLYLLAIIPLPIIVVIPFSSVFVRRINRSIEIFHREVGQITSVDDLSSLRVDDVDTGFRETNRIFTEIGNLFNRLKEIAADKHVLELEVKLLDKFVINTEVINDWRAHVRDLLVEIDALIGAKNLFVVFQHQKNVLTLESFWTGRPDSATRLRLDEIVKQRIRERRELASTYLDRTTHHVGSNVEFEESFSVEEIDSRIITLLLDTPRIGGAMGVGLQLAETADASTNYVIEGILATLVNVVGSMRAISRYTKDVEYYATRDHITNLYNQQVFWDMLTNEVSRARRQNIRFSLLVIDLDNFKLVNDRYGHAVGDELLKGFGRVLEDVGREGDIVARYGGDEFTVILPEADEETAYSFARKLQEAASVLSVSADDSKLAATVSIGIGVFPDHAEDEKNLFTIANGMMYKAKRAGKNRVSFPSDADIADVFREAGETSQIILSAIQESRIIPYFQPIVNIRSKKVEVHELLMRIEANGRVLSAGEFIDDAEKMGVVHKMDLLLMDRAFARMREEDYRGLLFVNLSPKALIIHEFISDVKRLAETHGIDHSQVVFELTERETVKNIALLQKFIKELKEKGFKFAVDDFGSGFSSFQYIKHFPIDFIKIEGEFIKNMTKDEVDKAFVKSVLTLARELSIKTVAEFVEEEEVFKALDYLGIDYAQGYYVDRPTARLNPSGLPFESLSRG